MSCYLLETSVLTWVFNLTILNLDSGVSLELGFHSPRPVPINALCLHCFRILVSSTPASAKGAMPLIKCTNLTVQFTYSIIMLHIKAALSVMLVTQSGEGNGTLLQYSCLENPQGQRSLVGCSPWGCEESDTTERLHFHVSLSCTGEGNGNPLQCSCLENPRDGGAWWTAVYGVAQSQTRLKRLSSRAHSVTLCYLHFLPALFKQSRQRPPYFDSILNSHYAYYLSALHLTQQNKPSDTEPAFPADRPCHNASVVSNSVQACELQPARLLCP